MGRFDRLIRAAVKWIVVAAGICTVSSAAARAASEGGLYIAGAGFTFQQAAQDAARKNPKGQRFFLLALPPQTQALMVDAPRQLAAVRDRVVAANGVLYVCQRDIDSGKIDAAKLVPEVVAVRGWPSGVGNALPNGARYFDDEDRTKLPASNNALSRLRSTCAP